MFTRHWGAALPSIWRPHSPAVPLPLTHTYVSVTMFRKEEKPGGARLLHRKGAEPEWDLVLVLTPSQHGCTGENQGGPPSQPLGGFCSPPDVQTLHPIPLIPQAVLPARELEGDPGIPPLPNAPSPVTLPSNRAPHLSRQHTGNACPHPSPSCRRCSPSPAGSAVGMRGGSAAAPAGAPLLGRTRRPFFSRRCLQNAPLVPAVGSGKGSKCQGVGLGYHQTAHGPRAPRAGLPTQPRPLGRQKSLSSPVTAKSLTWEGAQPHRCRGPTKAVPAAHRHAAPLCSQGAPASPHCPQAAICLSAPSPRGQGCSGGSLLPDLLFSTQTQAGHSTS